MAMRTVTTIAEVRAQVGRWHEDRQRVVFVPTMGNLHAGHMSLIEAARQHGDKFVASIFVNPMQFGPNEDFAHYPRTPAQDADMQPRALMFRMRRRRRPGCFIGGRRIGEERLERGVEILFGLRRQYDDRLNQHAARHRRRPGRRREHLLDVVGPELLLDRGEDRTVAELVGQRGILLEQRACFDQRKQARTSVRVREVAQMIGDVTDGAPEV